MLCLLFHLGQDRYALDTSSVEEVLPVVHWKEIPQALPGLLGLFDYRGEYVPLLDLSEFIIGRPSDLQMSTRIVLLHYRDAGTEDVDSERAGTQGRLLGLLVQQATFTFRGEPEDFTPAGVEVSTAPYLGPVMSDEQGIIQLIEVQRLLPPAVKEQLFLYAGQSGRETE